MSHVSRQYTLSPCWYVHIINYQQDMDQNNKTDWPRKSKRVAMRACSRNQKLCVTSVYSALCTALYSHCIWPPVYTFLDLILFAGSQTSLICVLGTISNVHASKIRNMCQSHVMQLSKRFVNTWICCQCIYLCPCFCLFHPVVPQFITLIIKNDSVI